MVAKLGNVSQLFPSEQQFPLMGVKDGDPIKYNQPLTLTSPTSMELNRLVGISSELIDLMTDTYELPSLPLVDLTDPPYRGFFVSRFANEIEYEYDGDPEDELSHIRGIYNGDDTAERNSELEYDYTEGVSYSSFQASKLVDKIIELTAQVHGVAPIYVQKIKKHCHVPTLHNQLRLCSVGGLCYCFISAGMKASQILSKISCVALDTVKTFPVGL